jgi:hypothetical protein
MFGTVALESRMSSCFPLASISGSFLRSLPLPAAVNLCLIGSTLKVARRATDTKDKAVVCDQPPC